MNKELQQFIQLYEQLRNFQGNIKKEPQHRRESLDRVHKLIIELGKLENSFTELRDEYNKLSRKPEEIKQVKEYVRAIENSIVKSRNILVNRLEEIVKSKTCEIEIERNLIETAGNMGEKFDLKTAASLLPTMDDTEDVTKQLIDAIQLYNEFLDNPGKNLLINYVLKIKISQNAKLRLEKQYNSVDELTRDMKRHLITKKSAAAMSTQLHSVKQDNKTLNEYAKIVEQLFINLTLAEAGDDDNAVTVLQEVNEKLAINAFSNGLKNSELRTIIKARNFSKLKDAINSAKEEELIKTCNNSQVTNLFHTRTIQNFGRGNRNGSTRRLNSNYYSYRGNRHNSYRNNNQNQNVSCLNQNQGRGRQFSQRRPVNNNRGRYSRRWAYFAGNAESTAGNSSNDLHKVENNRNKFFRVETE